MNYFALDVARYRFIATAEVAQEMQYGSDQPKLTHDGRPIFIVEVAMTVPDRPNRQGVVVRVKVRGERPQVKQGQLVEFSELETTYWTNEDRGTSGWSFSAGSVRPVGVSSGKAA